MKRPLILLTNDDGINFPGIRALKESLEAIGEVIIVAPDAERSAVGHAITIATPLRVMPVEMNGSLFGYAVNGTPADCVKLAVAKLLPRRPDIVVSGINPGENTAFNVLYSGTVSAATEGMIHNIPSVAFSLTSFSYRDFSYAAKLARQLVAEVLEKGLPEGTLLNVNIPPFPEEEIRGVRIASHGKGRYEEDFEERTDPGGRTYYWLSGKREVPDNIQDADDVLVYQKYVVISPIKFDLTDHTHYKSMLTWRIAKTNEDQ